jgi:MFS family permease
MARDFEFYYLQRSVGSTWETLQQAEAVSVLTDGLADRMVSLGGEVRIVGARFEEAENAWAYEQLFFMDAGAVDFTVTDGAPADTPSLAGLDRDLELGLGLGADGGVSNDEIAAMSARLARFKDRSHAQDRPLQARPRAAGPIGGPGDMAEVNMRLAYLALIMGGIIAALAFGIRSGFGLYLGPISIEFGYGREVFALSLAIQNLVWGVAQPFAGALADRYGPFKAIAVGSVLYAGGTILLAYSDTPGLLHLSAGILVGAALAGTSFGIILGAVGQLFPPEKRSFALGVTGAAGSLGQFLIVPAGQALLSAVGWSQSALIMGFVALLMLPLGLVFIKARPKAAPSDVPDQTIGEALREAFALPSFWLLTVGFFVCGFHVAYIAVHLPSFVVDIGLSAETGAWALGLVGLFNVIGSLMAGVLGGRFPKRYLLSGLYLGRALVMTGFVLLPPSEYLVYVFAGTMGLLWLSTVPLTSGLVADIFGPRYMSMLFGIVFLSHQVGGFLGAWLGGYVFDATGSYDLVWWISVGLGVFSGIVHWPIREQRVGLGVAPA